MFEKAARMKLRFSHKGLCTVEDLWDLPLANLDKIYKDLNAQVKAQKEESLLEEKSQADETLDLQIAIVRHVVAVRLAERKARVEETERATMKQKLLAIKAERQEAGLRSMPDEDLDKMINEL